LLQKIPNRVCVALSRAKHGLFVVGNIDFLADHSPLWANIRRSVASAGALGTALPIHCQRHGVAEQQQEQLVESAQDFDRLSAEGGCTQLCATRNIPSQQ
jgi:hypothetical protein